MPEIKRDPDWRKIQVALQDAPKVLQDAFRKAALQEGEFLRKRVIEAFQKGGPEGQKWAPLSRLTIAVRTLLGNKKRKLLIGSGDLRNSIKVIASGSGANVIVFIGVSRSTARKDGKDNVNIASIMEYGAQFTVRMTDKQRRLLFAAFRLARISKPKSKPRGKIMPKGGGTLLHITIPPRPFLAPVFDRYAKPDDVNDRIIGRVEVMVRGTSVAPLLAKK